MFLKQESTLLRNFVYKSSTIRLAFIVVVILNYADAQCPKVLIQGKVTSIDKYDATNCEFYILVDKVIQGYGLEGVNGNLVPGITVYTMPYPCSDIQIGDCVEVYGEWCKGDSPPIYGFSGWYIKKINCPSDQPLPPRCQPGPIGSPQCSGNAVTQLHQDANCNQYWQIIDDCNRYIPSRCCKNGRCERCGCQETYRCVDNVVQRLCVGENGLESWQVFDDCNLYDPPRRCVGGVCISQHQPPDDTETQCDQETCQSQNRPIGVKYERDGIIRQKYMDCNCINQECVCESVEKEICEDIKFEGEVIEITKYGIDPLCNGMRAWVSYPHYKIKLTSLKSGPNPEGDTIYLNVAPYWMSETDCSFYPKGTYDEGIAIGDKVEVLGCLEKDSSRVSISEKEYYYIKKISYLVKLNQTPKEGRPLSPITKDTAIEVSIAPESGKTPLTSDIVVANNKAIFYDMWIELPDGTKIGCDKCPNDALDCANCILLGPNDNFEKTVTFNFPENNILKIIVSRDTVVARIANTIDVIMVGAFGEHLPLTSTVIDKILKHMGGSRAVIIKKAYEGDILGIFIELCDYFSDMGNCDKFASILIEEGLVDGDTGIDLLKLNSYAKNISQGIDLVSKLYEVSKMLLDTYSNAPIRDEVWIWAEQVT